VRLVGEGTKRAGTVRRGRLVEVEMVAFAFWPGLAWFGRSLG
jgi:hypothetical protein